MHPRYLAILFLVLLAAASLIGVLFGLQQAYWIKYHDRYAAENFTKADQLQRTGQLEEARRADDDARRDQRYATQARRNQLLGIVGGGGVTACSVLAIVVLLLMPGIGRSAGGRFDGYFQGILQSVLRPGEPVLNTGFVFEGALRRPITYCAALTNQRLLLARTDMTLFGSPIFKGLEEIDLSSVGHCSAGGVAMHREVTLVFRNGETRNLRLNLLANVISGQQAFVSELPQRLARGGVNVV